MAAAAPPLQWLGWDGRTLHWKATLAVRAGLVLNIDGIAFERHALDPGDHVLHSRFDYSPTGNDELEFAIAADAASPHALRWRVRFAAAARVGVDGWIHAPARLAPLAGTPRLPPRPLAALPPAAVVVPIFNAAASLRRCLDALARFTPPAVRWILVDDASTDPAIAPLIAAHTARAAVRAERHALNRGYTHAVNTGIAAAGNADVVLLNSDTEVGPRWLESLRLAAYGEEAIGTVTAVSDNAGAFSVPELEQHCPTPPRWTLVEAQRAVLQQAGLRYPELPTGNGFCLYVKRELIERIGLFDAQAFPSGYGEENDFCQRAIGAGWRHVVAGNVLVRHERSASFGDARRAALGAQGMAVLRARYPRYEADVAATLYSFDRRVLDYRVRRAYAAATTAPPPRPRVLAVAAHAAQLAAAFAAIDAAGCEPFVLLAAAAWTLYCGDARSPRVAASATGAGDAASELCAALLVWSIEALVRTAAPLPELASAAAARLGLAVVDQRAGLAAIGNGSVAP